MVVFVTHHDRLAGTTHAMFLIMLLESLQPHKYGRIFFWLCFFGPEGIVGDGVQAYRWRLICIESLGENGTRDQFD